MVRSSSSVLSSAQLANQAQKPYSTAAAGASSGVRSSSSVLASARSAKQAQNPYRTAAAGASSVGRSSSSVLRQAPLAKQAQKPAAPSQRPRKAWCEICKIWCNTPEVLEDHKQGRRHMNKVKRHEKLQYQKAISGLHNKQTPATKWNLTDQALKVREREKNEFPAGNTGSDFAAVNHKNETVVQNKQIATTKLNLTNQATKVHEPEKSECPAGNTGSEVAAVNHKDETVVQNGSREISAVPAEEPEVNKTSRNTIPVQHHVGKQKKKRKGSKLVKIAAAALRRPVQNQVTELFIPFHCKLCNVKIESESAFQSHVNGSGHLSRLVSAPGRQALSGMFGLQVLYPPDINSLSKAINVQVQHGDNNPQLLLAKNLMDAISQSQVAATAPPMN
ncbi:hypothetical protein PIB30_013505 [Stylosanthes scabra]|nr:hypothetical protein [Stylosanthes scabra]